MKVYHILAQYFITSTTTVASFNTEKNLVFTVLSYNRINSWSPCNLWEIKYFIFRMLWIRLRAHRDQFQSPFSFWLTHLNSSHCVLLVCQFSIQQKKKKKFWTTNPPEYYIIILLAVKGNISVHTCVRMPHFLSDKNPHECKVAVRFKMNEGEKEDPFILTGLSRYISDSVKTGSLISMLPMAGAPCQVEYYFFFFFSSSETLSFLQPAAGI